jgi:hypothetical protein
MIYQPVKWRWMLSSVLAAAAVGCSGGGNGGGSTSTSTTTTPTPPATPSTDFSTLVYSVFAQPANSQPVSLDNLTIVYDVNNEPTDFDGLLNTTGS